MADKKTSSTDYIIDRYSPGITYPDDTPDWMKDLVEQTILSQSQGVNAIQQNIAKAVEELKFTPDPTVQSELRSLANTPLISEKLQKQQLGSTQDAIARSVRSQIEQIQRDAARRGVLGSSGTLTAETATRTSGAIGGQQAALDIAQYAAEANRQAKQAAIGALAEYTLGSENIKAGLDTTRASLIANQPVNTFDYTNLIPLFEGSRIANEQIDLARDFQNTVTQPNPIGDFFSILSSAFPGNNLISGATGFLSTLFNPGGSLNGI